MWTALTLCSATHVIVNCVTLSFFSVFGSNLEKAGLRSYQFRIIQNSDAVFSQGVKEECGIGTLGFV